MCVKFFIHKINAVYDLYKNNKLIFVTKKH